VTVFKRISRHISTGPSGPVFYTGLLAALLGFGLFFDHASSLAMAPPESVVALHSDLARARASPDVLQVTRWVIDSQDNAGLPFVVVDKMRARLFAFDAAGRLRASAPILLGAVRGDGPAVPATPAGRFMADTWRTALGDGIVWANADASLSLHGVSSALSPGHGRRRLASDAVEDKRISDGSLHVPDEFYQEHLGPLRQQASVAYVLPEVLHVRQVFGFVDSGPPRQQQTKFVQWPNPQARRPS
jgi:hypothetical protein